MRKVYYSILYTLIFLSSTFNLNASHFAGGEISWECVSEGRYVFKMNLRVNCYNNIIGFSNETIIIRGNPRPTDTSNNVISSIRVKPDSNKWQLYNQGDVNPRCEFNSSTANSLSCSNNDIGTFRNYYYKSDTIYLNGTPPQSGWSFTFKSACCMTDRENITQGASGTLFLKSIMYPNNSNQLVDSCYDSSPKFADAPWRLFCKGDNVSLDVSAIDTDFDSIVYSFDSAFIDMNTPFNYSAGYSYNNPTPNRNFNSLNTPASIDPNSGLLNFKVNSGSSGNYHIVVSADSYREGVKIASVKSNQLIRIMDCNATNTSPITFLGQSQANSLELNVTAGNLVTLPITINDTDLVGSSLQYVRSTFSSLQFADDYSDTSACINPPCAVLKNQIPTLDTIHNQYAIESLGAVFTTFEWQTDCNHILDSDSVGVYHFYFQNQDDHCLIPAKRDVHLKVVVNPLTASVIQNNNNVLSTPDQVSSYQWYDCNADTLISGAVSSSFTPSYNGDFAVILRNASCVDTSDCYTYLSVGLDSVNFKDKISFYPNPTRGELNVKFLKEENYIELKVLNIHGQLIQEKVFTNTNHLDFNVAAESGIYFIELTNRAGEKANFKVIKN
ncbi:MAG: hypothetical protein CMC96_08490 [Flavobacteriales bacterium]|nr:hypothetical protein [Flavobacteriales bacterium]MAC95526.1 hypothetical protein [Flavobacteriales bacterium]